MSVSVVIEEGQVVVTENGNLMTYGSLYVLSDETPCTACLATATKNDPRLSVHPALRPGAETRGGVRDQWVPCTLLLRSWASRLSL
jgi:hypothetical protein